MCPKKNGWFVHRWVGPELLVAEWERVHVCTSAIGIAGDMGSNCREDSVAVDEMDNCEDWEFSLRWSWRDEG
jgi:hypothetical protein